MPILRSRLTLGSLFWWINPINILKNRRRLMKIKLESMKTGLLKGKVDMPHQADVVIFSTLIIFNKNYSLMSFFFLSFRAK